MLLNLLLIGFALISHSVGAPPTYKSLNRLIKSTPPITTGSSHEISSSKSSGQPSSNSSASWEPKTSTTVTSKGKGKAVASLETSNSNDWRQVVSQESESSFPASLVDSDSKLINRREKNKLAQRKCRGKKRARSGKTPNTRYSAGRPREENISERSLKNRESKERFEILAARARLVLGLPPLDKVKQAKSGTSITRRGKVDDLQWLTKDMARDVLLEYDRRRSSASERESEAIARRKMDKILGIPKRPVGRPTKDFSNGMGNALTWKRMYTKKALMMRFPAHAESSGEGQEVSTKGISSQEEGKMSPVMQQNDQVEAAPGRINFVHHEFDLNASPPLAEPSP